MITPGSEFEIVRVPICKIVVKEYQVRYPDRLTHYINLMMANPDADPGFILLKRQDDGYFENLDGHHRFVAHIMTGRATALSIVITEP